MRVRVVAWDSRAHFVSAEIAYGLPLPPALRCLIWDAGLGLSREQTMPRQGNAVDHENGGWNLDEYRPRTASTQVLAPRGACRTTPRFGQG